MNTGEFSPASAGMAESFPALLTIPEAQRYLGASTPFTIYRLINLGRLPSVKVGKRHNIPREALDTFIRDNQRFRR